MSFRRELSYTIFSAKFPLADVAKFSIIKCRQTKLIFESVRYRRIVIKKIVKSFRQTGKHHDRIIVPLVHFNEELVQWRNLIGISVRKEFLNVIKEQYSTLGILNVIIPLINKTVIIDSIHYCQFRFFNNLMLIEIVTHNLSQ